MKIASSAISRSLHEVFSQQKEFLKVVKIYYTRCDSTVDKATLKLQKKVQTDADSPNYCTGLQGVSLFEQQTLPDFNLKRHLQISKLWNIFMSCFGLIFLAGFVRDL
jgi:hypothetical protein